MSGISVLTIMSLAEKSEKVWRYMVVRSSSPQSSAGISMMLLSAITRAFSYLSSRRPTLSNASRRLAAMEMLLFTSYGSAVLPTENDRLSAPISIIICLAFIDQFSFQDIPPFC